MRLLALVTRPATLLNPIAQAIIGAVIEVIGMTLLLGDGEGGVVVFFVTMAYTVACPIVIALRSGWFLNAVLACIGMVGLLLVVPGFTEMAAGRQLLGESAMLLLLPIMVFPCAMVLSGILRLILARRPQPAPPAA